MDKSSTDKRRFEAMKKPRFLKSTKNLFGISKITTGVLITALLISLFLVRTSTITGGQKAKSFADTCRPLLEKEQFDEIVKRLLTTADGPGADESIEALGEVLAVSMPYAEGVLNAFSNQDSVEAATLEAELLLQIAQGQKDAGGWLRWMNEGKKETQDGSDLVSVDWIGQKGVALLDHKDPFVRGFAEWAIAVRVGIENSRSLSVWPNKDTPQWYCQWRDALTPEFLLECDYVRQGAAVDVHRGSDNLLVSAKKIVDRARRISQQIDAKSSNDVKKKTRQSLSRLEKGYETLVEKARKNSADLTEQRKAWLALRHIARQVVLAAPDLDFEKIVFATRHAFHDGPNITAGAKSYIIKPGGDIFEKTGFNPGFGTRPLIDSKLPAGHMRGMELHWDADRIVFAYAEQPRYYEETLVESDQGFDDKVHGASDPSHIYEIGTNGNRLRKITDHKFNSDIEPAYLPDGDIIFCSDRSNYGSQCSGNFKQNKKIVNFYRTSLDGTGLRPLHNNKDFDRYPHVMENGLVVYTRWEYQERHLYQTHNVWTTRPDGTMTNAIYKEHINTGPMALRDPRQIPGEHKLVAIACGHHEYAQGAVTLIDYQVGVNDSSAMRIVTQSISPREGGIGEGKTVDDGGVEDDGGLYQQPYPLSEKSFLVSYSYHLPRTSPNPNNFGIYYIDVYGNKELIHRDPVLSSVYPIPLKKRPHPHVIPDSVKNDQLYASGYVADVYVGLEGVQRGTVKYLRISNRTEQPTFQTGDTVVNFNHLHYVPDGSWAHALGVWTWTPGRVIGVVPVEEDGSAYFKVPVNLPVYFHALDKNFMEIRRMRTFVSFQPGEIRGCDGCHETRNQAPPMQLFKPVAVQRAPSQPVPPSWGDTILPDFERHIQPIFTRHCADCHGQKEPAGGLEFTARKVDGYNQSYRTMFGLAPDVPTPVWSKDAHLWLYPESKPFVDKAMLTKMSKNQYPGQLISLSDRFSDASITQPKEFGSFQSKLITTLLKEPHKEKVQLSQDEWIDLVTWVDLNAPYWGSYLDKDPLRQGQRPKRVFVEYPAPFKSPAGSCKIVETEDLPSLDAGQGDSQTISFKLENKN
jgi:hypothetical protein